MSAASSQSSSAAEQRQPIGRAYSALLLGGGISSLGTGMSIFLLPLVGYRLTGSLAIAATLSSLYSIGRLVLRLPGGVLVDTFNRRGLFIAASASAGILYLLLSIDIAGRFYVTVGLLVVAVATGLATTVIDPVEVALVREVVPAAFMPTAMSQYEVRSQAASLVGGPLGGVLLALGSAVPFLFDAVSYGVAVACGLLLPRSHRESKGRLTFRGHWNMLVDGVRFVWTKAPMRAIVYYSFLANIAAGGAVVTVNLKLLRDSGAPTVVGLVDACAGAAGLLGALVAPWLLKRAPLASLAAASTLLFAVALLPIAATSEPFVVAGMLAISFLVLPAANAATMGYLFTITPPDFQGRTGAALGLAGSVASPIGPALAAWGLSALGGAETLVLFGLVMAGSAAPLMLNPHLRSVGTPESWQNT